MQSIILIGDKDFGLKDIKKLSHSGSIKTWDDPEEREYTVKYENGYIWYQQSAAITAELMNEYEEGELIDIPIRLNQMNFILVAYKPIQILKKVFLDESWNKNIWIDNNHGLILSVEEFMEKIREKPDWDWRLELD
ncbi:hypothetical protein [Shimazuella kribbensis]|uniref:hypothetical protein n=1 Tax=Shimazuella kribbensis TaxID=139808 RepID=UPI00041ED01C|nr:hypothetical protein [Shimazuella kribbensis]